MNVFHPYFKFFQKSDLKVHLVFLTVTAHYYSFFFFFQVLVSRVVFFLPFIVMVATGIILHISLVWYIKALSLLAVFVGARFIYTLVLLLLLLLSFPFILF